MVEKAPATGLFPDKYHIELKLIQTQYRDDGTIYDVVVLKDDISHQEESSGYTKEKYKEIVSKLEEDFK